MVLPEKKNETPNDVYIKRYKDFIRLVKISKMLSSTKIIINSKQR